MPKVRDLLKPGGTIALFWHLASIVEPQTDPLMHIRSIYQKHAPELDDFIDQNEALAQHEQRLHQLSAIDRFADPVSLEYRWNDFYTAERYLKLMNSYSDFHSIHAGARNAIRSEVFDYLLQNGGSITIPQQVWLYRGRKN